MLLTIRCLGDMLTLCEHLGPYYKKMFWACKVSVGWIVGAVKVFFLSNDLLSSCCYLNVVMFMRW